MSSFKDEIKGYMEIISTDDIYRELSKEKRDELIENRANKILALFNDIRNGNIIKSCIILDATKEIIDNLYNKNIKKLHTLRWNISDIIIKCEEINLKNKDTKQNHYHSINHFISELRTMMMYIDKTKNDNLFDSLRNIEILHNKNEDLNKKIKGELEHSYKNIEKIEETLRDILPQTISIISIFVTILIVFFSGFSLIQSLESLSDKNIQKYIFILILISGIMFNSFILLMYLTSRVSGRSINVRCSKFLDKKHKEIADELKNMRVLTKR